MARTTLESLRNEDYTDRELLHIIQEIAENNGGFATTYEVRDRLGIKSPDHDPHKGTRSAGSRLGYMRRVGLLDRRDDTPEVEYRVSRIGKLLMRGQLNQAAKKALNQKATRVLAMREMGQNYDAETPDGVMLRREWNHHTGRR